MEDQLIPLLGIDEFKARLGEDQDIITLNFVIKSKEAGDDLVIWLERGYDFILDAEVSPGEVKGEDWSLKIDRKRYPATKENIASNVALTTSDYREKNESELNEWREIAGLKTVKTYESDNDIIEMQRQAGIL